LLCLENILKLNFKMKSFNFNILLKKDKDIFKKNNLKSFIWLLIHVTLILVAYITVIYSINFFIIFVALILLGLFSSFTGLTGAAHEFYHNTVFTNKLFNQFLYKLLCFYHLINFEYNSISHRMHHRYNSEDENDSEKTIEKITYLDLLFLLTINVPQILNRSKNIILNSFNIFPKSIVNNYIQAINVSSESFSKIKSCARFILSTHIIFIFFSYYFEVINLYLIFFISPFIFNFMQNMVARSQHYMLDHNTLDTFKNTRTIKMSKFFEFLNWNMNYHIEHHINPAIPFHNLPKFNNILKSQEIERTVNSNSFEKEGIFQFILRIFKDNFLLKKFS